MNIERDVVIEHGRWCLERIAPRQYLSRDTGAREAIQAVIDRRRTEIAAGAYCEGVRYEHGCRNALVRS